MAPSIPDRWIPYKPFGSVIEGTRIICFKVPLRKLVQENSKEKIEQIWDIETMLTKIPNLGYVIDLTNTARYYSPSVLTSAGVMHKKIMMPGRILPPESSVNEFFDTVDQFLGNDDGKLVGVHCTHGLNRTGYMVCRYMRDRLGVPPEEAIKRFEAGRGYKIERENYIADILGKNPPPPNFGKNTTVVPVKNVQQRNHITYRSPLDGLEEYNDEQRYADRHRRRGYAGRADTSRDRSPIRMGGQRDDISNNRFDRIPRKGVSKSERHGGHSSRRKACDQARHYDYKHDY